MSIWCSWPHVGTDPNDWREMNGTPVPKTAERGNVISFAEGFGNHYPDLSGTHERPAAVALAHIPEWCVPGHSESDDEDINGPWLRLEVAAPETLNFWEKDDDGNPKVESEGATVVMDEAAVRALRDDLSEWLDRPKVHPLP